MKRKSLIAILMLMLGSALSVSTVQNAATTIQTFELGVNEHKLWDGDYVDTTTMPKLGQGSYTYTLVTQNGGSRLRVALGLVPDYRRNEAGEPKTVSSLNDGVHPNASGGKKFKLEVFDKLHLDEQGKEKLIVSADSTGSDYSNELFICFNKQSGEFCERVDRADLTSKEQRAAALSTDSGGEWTVKVTPTDSSGWFFRMRAKLEQASNTQASSELLNPNLRAMPPFELTFCEPLMSVGFLVGQNPICGSASNGLTDQEEADLIAHEASHGPVKPFRRGLRFSAGPENIGDGHLELEGSPSGIDPETGNVVANAVQRIYARDKTSQEYPAGQMEFHPSHGHWHYPFFKYELFKGLDPNPTANFPSSMAKVSEAIVGTKSGFCPSDERLADWSRFYQSVQGRRNFDQCDEDLSNPRWFAEASITCTSPSGCLSPTRPNMGLSSGWADFYEWARIEQFVEFPVNLEGSPQDGLYLLRATVDAERTIIESNEGDNASYALFKVEGGRITIIKSGYGPEP